MKYIVSAGPTREYLDPVRYLSNPSSGLTGFAIAAAAAKRGGETVLVAGPGVTLETPPLVRRVDVVSARDMCDAVRREIASGPGPVALVMTAAVADWRPETCAPAKMKKSDDVQTMTLRLVRNPDILKTVSAEFAGRENLALVGFAAETGDPAPEALRKCREKHLLMVVGNDVSAPGCGFAVRENRVVFAYPSGRIERMEMMPKEKLAEEILTRLERERGKIVLASGSPRRAKILAEAGVAFEVFKTSAPETARPDDPAGTVVENAAAKWRAAKEALGAARPILAADTIVWMDGRIFGKPRDAAEAKEFLRALSGRAHFVYTGVAFGAGAKPRTHCERSEVVFKELSADDIERYAAAVNPVDRAGAYDIDDHGDMVVARYAGSYENIMGLPIESLKPFLAK